MSLDNDLVRVDLLRCKRLIYLQYPEGSQEQKDFLYASKLSELGYLKRLVPEETAVLVYEEYNHRLKFELLVGALCFGLGIFFSYIMFLCHQAHPNIIWLKWFSFPFGFGMYFVGKHIYHMVIEWRKMKPFKIEHKQLLQRIEKLTNELKDIIK